MKLKDIADAIGGELVGEADVEIIGVGGVSDVKEGMITFAETTKAMNDAEQSSAGAIIVGLTIVESKKPLIRVKNPRAGFAQVLQLFAPKHTHKAGIHTKAEVREGCRFGANVVVSPHCYVGCNAVIGDNTQLYPNVYIGDEVQIGKDCVIYPAVVIEDRCVIGDRCIIHSGAVIGADGFGYVYNEGRHEKIPQIGMVNIGDDVEIGANTTIDRGTTGATLIGNGVKIDNLVQIAHNVVIGNHCIIVAQAGIAGSTTIGDYAVLGGQVGVKDHVKIGAGAQVGSQGGVTGDIEPGAVVWGTPARNMKEVLKVAALTYKLPALFEKVKALEKAITEGNDKLK